MISVPVFALLGAGVGGGLFAVAYGLVPRQPSLAQVAAQVRVGSVARSDRPTTRAERLATRLTGTPTVARRGDLAVVERTAARHALDKLTWAALATAVPTMIIVGWTAAGISIAAVWWTPGLLIAAVVGWLWPDAQLRTSATRRRQAWGHALANYLDLVVILLAGGAGAQEALHAASQAGAGPEYQVLASTLAIARIEQTDPWTALDDLGTSRNLRPLRELAASMGLAGSEGSKVRDTLKAKAVALRERELAESEAQAQKSTETMSIAPAAMLGVFVLLLGYPAVATFMGGH